MFRKRVLFYPSQIGGLIGKNPYKNRDDELECLIHRYKTNETKIIDNVDIPQKYDEFIKKQIESDNSVRIKNKVRRLTCDEDVKSAIQTKIYKERGIAMEIDAIRDYEEKMNVKIQRPTHFIQKHLVYNNKEFFIGGKIDGMITSSGIVLVEVKNRQNCFIENISDFERIQIECYMRLINAVHCVFIQRFEGENRVEIYYPDDDLWNDILSECSKIVDKVVEK